MKKPAAILLCLLLAFNWIGYRVFVGYIGAQAGDRMESDLDQEQYHGLPLLSVKVPAAHLSFYVQSGTFERASGELTINGTPYRFVKKRFFNDSLEYLCIQDQAAITTQSVNNDFSKQSSDFQQSTQSKKQGGHAAIPRIFSPDYLLSGNNLLTGNSILTGMAVAAARVHFLQPVYLSAREQPPESNA